mgnify:CR=1 FL=1
MKKLASVWFDTERQQYRVCTGRRLKTHIGRYETEEEAEEIASAVDRAYCIGWLEAIRSVAEMSDIASCGFRNGDKNRVEDKDGDVL